MAYDAGAAKILFSWLTPLSKELRFYVGGPALQLLEKTRPETNNSDDLSACLRDCQLLLSGTGWSSDLEHQARLIADHHGIYSIAVLDHWVNYRERFVRDEIMVLPKALWVSDTEAASLAKKQFPGMQVQQHPNQWLNALIREVDSHRKQESKPIIHKPGTSLLYLLEPLRDRHSGELTGGEFTALDYWLEQLPSLMASGCINRERRKLDMRLRPHPSEPADKYEKWINRNGKEWPLRLDPHPSLAISLAHSDITFGCETQALVAAMACQIPAICTLPPFMQPCRLPHRQLQQLTEKVSF